MPKRRPEDEKDSAQVRAAQEMLRTYLHGKTGRQKNIAEASGIYASMLSRMANGHNPISLDVAIALEVATAGDLRAEALCPARADVLQRFVTQRQNSIGAGA